MNARRQAPAQPDLRPSPREKQLFLAVLARPAPKRRTYLRRHSWFRPRLRARIEALLTAHSQGLWLEEQHPYPTAQRPARFPCAER